MITTNTTIKKHQTILFIIMLLLCIFALLFPQNKADNVYSENSAPISRTAFFFDTVITLTVYTQSDEAVLDKAIQLCNHYEQLWNKNIEESDIYKINHADGASTTVSSETIEIIKTAIAYSEQTNGAFDITVSGVSSLWNFTDKTLQTVPNENTLTSALSHVNYQHIIINDNTITLADSETNIDLGALAKGYISDRIKELFIKNDVEHALINLGGNIVTLGSKPNGDSYALGIQKPFGLQDEIIRQINLTNQSLVTSGVYQRYFEQDGILYHHILNTENGMPVNNNLLSATIISKSSLQGDALSTTCMLLGLEEGLNLIESTTDVEAIFIDSDYQIHVSGGLYDDGTLIQQK